MRASNAIISFSVHQETERLSSGRRASVYRGTVRFRVHGDEKGTGVVVR